MKTDGDLAQRLSDSCVKTTLALLVLCGVAAGLAERIQKLSLFESYWRFLSARANLEVVLADLPGDHCWQSFIRGLPDPKSAGATTIADLKRIECTLNHDQMRVNYSRTITPGTSDPSSLEFLTPEKDASSRSGWYPLGVAELIESSLVPLWDDPLLMRGELYSSVAADDIYRWQVQRFQVQQQRGLPLVALRLPRSNAISESNFLQLQVDDLSAISRLTRSPLSDLDHGLHDFRASIPDTSMDFDLGLAVQAVTFVIVIFTAVLAAYVRVAGAHELFNHPATIFYAMLGSRFTEFVGYLIVLVPAISMFTLARAAWNQGGAILFVSSGMSVVWATFSILRRLRPHTKWLGRRKL